MLQADVGIVFHHLNYSESSVIIKVLTREHGLVSILKKGAKRKRSKTSSAAFQSLSMVAVEYYASEHKELYTAKSVELWKPYKTLHSNILKSSVLLFINEILYKSIQHQEANTPLFEFIESYLTGLDQLEFNPDSHLWFMARLTSYLGISPDVDGYQPGYVLNLIEGNFSSYTGKKEDSTPESARCIVQLLGTKFAAIAGLKTPAEMRRETLQTLVDYYETQLEGIKSINSHLVLKELLE